MSKEKKSVMLRKVFESKETEYLPLGIFPIHAQMVEAAGFKAMHISGAFFSWWYAGHPDNGIMSRTDMVDNARRCANSVDIPIYCDADTGFGGIQNVYKTVQEFIYAGVAGIHIEDQLDPKKAGGKAGIAIVSDEEAIGRLRCACEARDETDPDFVIVARTDGYGTAGGSVEEALRRGQLYKKETGADVIFYEGIGTWDEIRYLLKNTPGPCYCTQSLLAGPAPSIDELTKMGQATQTLPFVVPGVQEVWKLLLQVKETGSLKPYEDYINQCFGPEEWRCGFGDKFVKPSYDQVRNLEDRFLPIEMQRDYNNFHDN